MRFGCNLQQEGNCYGADSGMLNCGVLTTPGRQKKKKERIIIKSERKGFIFDRQFAGIWMYAWVVDFLLSLDEKKEEGVSLGTRANSLVKRLR